MTQSSIRRLDRILQTVRTGTPILIKYRDHTFFKDNSDASQQAPRVLSAIGRLDFQNDEYVKLIWEEYSEPNSSGPPRVHSTGLSILKTTIVELRVLSRERSTKDKGYTYG